MHREHDLLWFFHSIKYLISKKKGPFGNFKSGVKFGLKEKQKIKIKGAIDNGRIEFEEMTLKEFSNIYLSQVNAISQIYSKMLTKSMRVMIVTCLAFFQSANFT